MKNKTSNNAVLTMLPMAALTVLVGLLAVGCRTSAVFWESHRVFPKKPRFSIEPKEYASAELDAAGIRTDGVYVRIGWRPQELQDQEEAEMRRKGWRTGSPFIRFWANGRTMSRLPKVENLSATHTDSFERARMGYYRILSDGTIEEEVYSYNPGKWDYDYFKSRFKIEDGTIWFDAGHGRRHQGEPIQLGYRFVPIPGMRAEPDW